MPGELGPIWPSAWNEIWLPLMRHPKFGDDLALDLFREHVPEPQLAGSVTELSEKEFHEFELAVRAHDEASTNASKAKDTLEQTWFDRPITEKLAINFLEKSYPLFEEYDDGNFSNEYFNRVDRFLKRFNLRYDLRRPLTLHPTLSGIFASLIKELHKVALLDPHLQQMLGEFEESVRDFRTDFSQVRVKTCLQKQFNLLEAIGRSFPGVTRGTLGEMVGQINSWPHVTVGEALKRLYGFRSNYPGLGHAGNPASVLRDLDTRDMIAIGVMLAGFVPYLSNQMDAQLVYGGE